MVVSFDWLKQYINISESAEEIAEKLTDTGLEVEGVKEFQLVEGGLEGLVIGEVLTCKKHPNADSLSITTVDIGGEEPSNIVCGAPNVAVGQKVVVATVGAKLYPEGEEPFKIKKSKIRGEVSLGMICAEDEIGLGDSHNGIMVLDTGVSNGTPAAEYFNLTSDSIIEIGLTPNRADGASHIGVCRDLKAVLGREVNFPSVDSFKIDNTNAKIEVTVENNEACPRYSGLVIKNIKVGPSPDWLKNRLKSIGINSTNNVVDITNFVLHEVGQPLHAFDLDVVGEKVVVKTGLEGAKFTTLDAKERTLLANDLMICNATKPMCIAGVFGGNESGVSEQTTSIFLESAYFSADFVRKSSMKHGLKTDASFRYERGTDPNITVYALKRAALLIQELAGGDISSDIIDIYPNPIENFKIDLEYSRLNKLIGAEIEEAKVDAILESLDIKITLKEGDKFSVEVPPYRVDVTREADILEEIIRIYGYNSFPERPIKAGFIASFDKPSKFELKEKIADLLTANGFSEIITNSITNSSYFDKHEFLDKERLVNILNYNSEDLDVLRTNMLFSSLEVLKANINRRQKNLKMYDFGKVYSIKDGEYSESEKLAIVMYGNENHESWLAKDKKTAFINLYSTLTLILNRLGISFKTEPMENPKKFAYGLKVLTKKGDLLGRMGVVNPAFSEQFGIEQDVFMLDLNWEKVIVNYKAKVQFKELSKFPMVRRDLSLVLDKSISFDEIKVLAEKTERKLLKGMNVFDVYVGKNIGEDKKAYSVTFDLQDQNKTLNDKAIDKTMDRLMKAYENELGALIRGK